MRRLLVSAVVFVNAAGLSAQKVEQGFDYAFRPTNYTPRYYVVTEKKDTLWHRQAWFVPERGMAMDGWYKDKDCKIEHGIVSWYHPEKFLKSRGAYVNGSKEGTWLEYDEKGRLRDSAYYVAGRLKGVRMHWHEDGMSADSMQFDGAGNGVEVSWYEDGKVSSAGYWVSDTIKKGRWKYFDQNEKLWAIEDYANGKLVTCNCFDEAGKALDSAACLEKEAEFTGGMNAWIRFIQRNLNADVPVKNRAAVGQYTVVVRFVVEKDGSIGQVRPMTHFGFGMEEEVVRMLKRSPNWSPGRQRGRKVKAYHMQPITFVVSNGM